MRLDEFWGLYPVLTNSYSSVVKTVESRLNIFCTITIHGNAMKRIANDQLDLAPYSVYTTCMLTRSTYLYSVRVLIQEDTFACSDQSSS